MMKKYKMFVGGEWVSSSTNETFESINPYTQQPWATIPEASEDDVNRAIESARNAFYNVWKETSGYERSKLLNKLAELIEENADHLSDIETTDNGKVKRETDRKSTRLNSSHV